MHVSAGAGIGLDLAWMGIALVAERAPGAPIVIGLLTADERQGVGRTAVIGRLIQEARCPTHCQHLAGNRDRLTQIENIAGAVCAMAGCAVHRRIGVGWVVIGGIVGAGDIREFETSFTGSATGGTFPCPMLIGAVIFSGNIDEIG